MVQPVAQPRHAVQRSGFANPLTLDIKVTNQSFVHVYADDDLLTLGVDYTIDGLGDPNGIEITIIDVDDPGAYPDTLTFAAVFMPLVEQNADLSAGGRFGIAFEEAIDAIVRQSLSFDDRLRRSLILPPTYSGTEQVQFPLPEPGRVLVGNATSTGYESGPTVPEISGIVGITDQINIVAEIADEIVDLAPYTAQMVLLGPVAGAIGQLGPVAGAISILAPLDDELVALAAIAAQILAVGDNIGAVVAVNGALTAVNTVSANIAAVSTTAANIAAIIAAPAQASAAAASAAAAAASALSINPLVLKMDARENLFVNSSMQDSPENGMTLGTVNGFFAAEMFALYFSASTAAMSVQLVATRTLSGSDRAVEFKTTTAKASLGVNDYVTLTTIIEGSRPEWKAAAFGTATATPLVLRKEVVLPAGLYHWRFSNSAGNLNCVVPFTVSAGEANTRVVKTITVPACTTGTWLFGDGDKGLVCELVLAAGSSLTGGTASTWGATVRFAATTQFNILSSTANVARLADVGLKNDPDATAVYGLFRVGEKHALYRSERYYYKRTGREVEGVSDIPVGGTGVYLFYQHPSRMAKTPTAVKSGTWAVSNVGQPTLNDLSEYGLLIIASATASGLGAFFPDTGSMQINARL